MLNRIRYIITATGPTLNLSSIGILVLQVIDDIRLLGLTVEKTLGKEKHA
jgi:hypothetical protein